MAAGRPRQELAQRHQVGIGLLREPATAFHKLGAKIAKVGDGATEGGQAQQQEGAEDVSDAPCRK
ncbi:hypothetical protein Q427_22195 [Halomonas sp. BC04]|nr:hypothetical protein Q427_22195 [Halomonas sp. BC04]